MNDSSTFSRIDTAIDEHLDNALEDLARLVAVPSVAAQNTGIDECAELVADMLNELGVAARLESTSGNPVVIGEAQGASDKTLLFYLHYDVQPAEPLDLWQSPPFDLTRRGDKFYGRGASDDKGNIIARLAALRAVLEVTGELPCNVKFCIEGEEEIGSPNLPAFVAANTEMLAADACIWEFGGVNFNGVPEQVLGMRGICYVELSVKTAEIDTHSGLGGSVFQNAAWRLVWALNTLKDDDERILIPGFYDDVIPPTKRDMELLEALPADRWERYQQTYGLVGFLKGMTDPVDLSQAGVFEPTCTICGLDSGYQGTGSKTVLPAEARAKVDFRLVPDQHPEDILAKLREHLDAEGFSDVQITYHGGEPPARTDPDHPFIALVNAAAEDVYGMPPVIHPMIGGSGPNHAFIHHLDLPVAVSGVGYPGSLAHAPNEHIILDNFRNGIRHAAHILMRFGEA